MSAIFHRSLEKLYPTAVRGDGVYLIDSNGRKILDGSSGAVVSSIGHNNKEVADAIANQIQNLEWAHTFFFTSDPAEELARFLLAESDNVFAKAMFFLSGSEAVESSLKIARQYHVYNGQPERVNFIGRASSYHGNTLGALAAGKNGLRRDTFSPILAPVFHHVSRCFYSRDGQGLTEAEYEDKLISEYEDKILSLGPTTVAAVILEPVGGATIGAVGPTKNYLKRLKDLCIKYEILLIFDEVMCGLGRTGTYHAWQGLGGVEPDLQTIGKGLGAGYLPLAALLVNGKIFDVFQKYSKGANSFVSGHTFQGHPTSCAAAYKVQSIIKRDKLIENVHSKGELLSHTILATFPIQADIEVRGYGLMRAVDFKNMQNEYGGPLAKDVSDEAFNQGATVYICSSDVDGVMFAPPFIISHEQIVDLARIFAKAVSVVLERRGY